MHPAMKLMPATEDERAAQNAVNAFGQLLIQTAAELPAGKVMWVTLSDGFTVITVSPMRGGILRLDGFTPDGASAARLIHAYQADFQMVVVDAAQQHPTARREIGYHTGFKSAGAGP